MPNYKYKCKCGNEFSVNRKMSEMKTQEKCPLCNKMSDRKIDDMVASSIWKCSGNFGKSTK